MRHMPSTPVAVALTCIATLSAFASLTAVTHARPAQQVFPRPTPERPTACVGDVIHERAPGVVLLGETVAVTMMFRGLCAGVSLPQYIVLVADPSSDMGSVGIRDMRRAMVTLVDGLDLTINPGTFMGVIDVGDEARTHTVLVNDAARVKSAIRKVRAGGDTRIDLGIDAAVRMLRLARQSMNPHTRIDPDIVVFSDGRCATGCGDAIRSARNADRAGSRVIAVCVGNDCDERCMREIASSPSYFFHIENADRLMEAFLRIRKDIRMRVIKSLVLTETLAPDVAYVPDSAQPPATLRDGGRSLVWSTNYLAAEGFTATLRVKPLAVALARVSHDARAWFKDN